jgi:hypothetical protein
MKLLEKSEERPGKANVNVLLVYGVGPRALRTTCAESARTASLDRSVAAPDDEKRSQIQCRSAFPNGQQAGKG